MEAPQREAKELMKSRKQPQGQVAAWVQGNSTDVGTTHVTKPVDGQVMAKPALALPVSPAILPVITPK